MFLQSRGIRNVSKQDLKKYLTGDPVWFVTEKSSIRVPIVGIHKQCQGFEAPPCEVPESLLSHVIQQQSDRLTSWIQSLSTSCLDRVLCRVAQVALRRDSFFKGWKRMDPHHIYISESYNLKIDVQRALVMCNDSEIRPIPSSMYSYSDFERIFGDKIIHCTESKNYESCQKVNIVGSSYRLVRWDKPRNNEDQGVGVPSPVPSLAFSNPLGMPSRDKVKKLLSETVFLSSNLRESSGDRLIGLFFGTFEHLVFVCVCVCENVSSHCV